MNGATPSHRFMNLRVASAFPLPIPRIDEPSHSLNCKSIAHEKPLRKQKYLHVSITPPPGFRPAAFSRCNGPMTKKPLKSRLPCGSLWGTHVRLSHSLSTSSFFEIFFVAAFR